MFTADPKGILMLITVALSWGLAFVLFRVSSPDSAARKLSFLLVLEGLVLFTSSAIDWLLVSKHDFFELYPSFQITKFVVHHMADMVMLALYPPFLALALQTKLTQPFATRKVRIGLWFVAAFILILAFTTPPQLGLTVLYLSMTLLFVFALIASVKAWRTSTGAARSRAFVFMLAFGFRDICWGFVYLSGVVEMWLGIMDPPQAWLDFNYMLYVIGTLGAVPLIAYGILRTHLFDIDLQIRWTIKQSTVGIAIFAIVLVISEGAEFLLSDRLGDYWGLLAAVVIAFSLRPLQRFAEKVASAAMPNTHNTPEYKSGRKRQVYESAIAEALQDGGISAKERSLLVLLRDSLGISASEAEQIEAGLASHQAQG